MRDKDLRFVRLFSKKHNNMKSKGGSPIISQPLLYSPYNLSVSKELHVNLVFL